VIDLDKYDRVCKILKDGELLSIANEIYNEFLYDEHRDFFIFSDRISGTDIGYLGGKIGSLSLESFQYLLEILEVFGIGFATLEDNYSMFTRNMKDYEITIEARRIARCT